MKIFKLPDLGEGLPDAIIRKWYVNVGDKVKKDEPMVAMETAKALVDVPAPFDVVIEKQFGNVDDTIETGMPLIGFEGEADESDAPKDTGTVVGKIEQSETLISKKTSQTKTNIKATPAVRALARKLGVDLSSIATDGLRITAEAVQAAAKSSQTKATDNANFEPLSNVKRAMVMSMQRSHQDIVPVTLQDDADIHAWKGKQDITIRIIRAIIQACAIEPALNAHFDNEPLSIKRFKEINLGVAVDMPHGLYVPVIKDVANKTDDALRQELEKFKTQAQNKTIAQDDLHGATIVLSNFGMIAGRYANPIILPPTVAIVGIGRLMKSVVPDENDQPAVHQILPLSLSVDHRVITGGEAARFLRGLMDTLGTRT